MMKSIHALAITIAIFSFLASACVDNHAQNKPGITGNWAVFKAFRDKRQTSLLNGVYFQFAGNGKMRTNLPNTSQDTDLDYVVEKDQIVQKSDTPLNYKIENVSDSILILSFEMNNTPFELHLSRVKELNIPVQQPDTLQ